MNALKSLFIRMLALLFLFSAVSVAYSEYDNASIPKIPFEKYTLPNGLQVILHEDHSTPIVCVDLWYHVGSKNEQPGRTGFAHLFEHMMFQGSKHFDNDYFLPLQKAGGRVNGSTSDDRTNYWEVVPSNFLELALWMESDRMAFLLPAMTQQRLDNQRSVVKNERRQSYENRPYGMVPEIILAALFPPGHPYSWITIGSMADIDAASREDVADFFRRYYNPSNASLCIAGDFDPAVAKKLVKKYFASIPAGPKVEKLNIPITELKESKRIKMTDRVGLARLYLNWLTVPVYAPDDAELEILADILAGGKASRLYRRMVRDMQIAQDVSAAQRSMELGGIFTIMATARPGKKLSQLEKVIKEELQRIQNEPPTEAEVARAVAQRESTMVQSLEGVGEFGGRADQLNMYNVLAGDPGYITEDFQRCRKVKPEDVQRVAKKYLGANNVLLEVTPGAKTYIEPDPRIAAEAARKELAKNITKTPVEDYGRAVEDADRLSLPAPKPEPRFNTPVINRAKLSNGMSLLVVENHEMPALSLRLVFPFGKADESPKKNGLAWLTAAVWDEGTEKRTSEQIAEELANIGATLNIRADSDDTTASLYTLKRNLPKALDIFGDVILHPTFANAELQRQRNIAIGRLAQIRNEPLALGLLAINQLIYGYDHPYGKPSFGLESTLESITADDLRDYYHSHACPVRATLIVVGDITLPEAKAQLEKIFGDWKVDEETKSTAEFAPPEPHPAAITLVDKPGAAQSVVGAVLITANRNTPDYFPLILMNSALGGQFASRLNMNLREDKGYTYGARSILDWCTRDKGDFIAYASVQNDVTAPTLQEILTELKDIAGPRPVEGNELDYNKKFMIRGFPAYFETSSALASHLKTLALYHLPDDYFENWVPSVQAVSSEDVLKVAKKYLLLENLAVIIVGDSSKIESSLRKLPLGKDMKVVRFDKSFRLVPEKPQKNEEK
ncbi:MAG: M16 family metallopeptidase [Thermoguttaceae bacterium]